MIPNIPSIPFTINARGGVTRFSDIARTFNWQMLIPTTILLKVAASTKLRELSEKRSLAGIANIPSATAKINSLIIDEDLLVKCRSISIPSKTVSQITTSFMGHKRYFPSKVDFSHNIDIEYEENELQTIKVFFDNWISAIEDTNFSTGAYNGNRSLQIENYTSPLFLSLRQYNGLNQAKNFTFFNCYPTSIRECSLNYSDNGSIKYVVSFSFDYYELANEPFIRVPGIS